MMVEKEDREYLVNEYNMRKIGDKFLLTTHHGGWVALTKEEYHSLIRFEISEELFGMLERQGIIITKESLPHLEKSYRRRYNFLRQGASLFILIPTLRCNQKCIYCHSSAREKDFKKYDMTENTAERVLDFVFQTPSPTVELEFQGGEPILQTQLVKFIVRNAREKNKKHRKRLNISLVTNTTLLSDSFVKWCKNNGVEICTSLDGPEDIHNKNRPYEGGGGTYEKVNYWIERCNKKYQMGCNALMVTTKYGLDKAKEIIDEYVQKGLMKIQLKKLSKLGYADSSWENINYSAEEFLEFWKKGMDYILELNKKGTNIQERITAILLKKIISGKDPGYLDIRSPCGIASGQLAFNYNGDIYSCDEGRNFEMFNLGNVRDLSYQELFKQKKTQEMILASITDGLLCDRCVYKPYCGTCVVMNYSEEGNIIPKLGKNSNCKVLKGQFDYLFKKLLSDREARKIMLGWIGREDFELNAHISNQKSVREEIEKIIRKIDSGKKLTIEKKQGCSNENYIINKKYFLKLYNVKEAHLLEYSEKVKSLRKVLLFLERRMKVPKLVLKEELVIGNKKGFLHEYIKKPPEQGTEGVLERSIDFHKNITKMKQKILVPSLLFKLRMDFRTLISLPRSKYWYIDRNLSAYEEFMNNYETYTKHIIHCKITPENLAGDRLSGFDNLAYGPRIYDIANSIYSLLERKRDKSVIKRFLEIYKKEGLLNKTEEKQIPNSIRVVAMQNFLRVLGGQEQRQKSEKMLRFLDDCLV